LTSLVLAGSDGSAPPAAQVAHLLEETGGPGGAARLGAAGLVSRRLLSTSEASRLAAALELGRRALLHSLSQEREVVGSFESVAAWARPRLAGLEHEEVWLLLLDGANGLKCASRIAQGGLHGCALTPRDVLRPALRDGASAMVLVHNHPSGDPTPSVEDLDMTRAVAIAGDVVGVPLLDHVVVARGGAASLFEADPRAR
jgi:DNA repair protein RadC